MRALLLHGNKFKTTVVEESNYPEGIDPEVKKSGNEQMENCLIAFFTVEKGDGEDQLNKFFNELTSSLDQMGLKKIMIAPFVHLSNNIASPADSKYFYEKLMSKFSNTDYEVKSSHYGYHKSLLLDIKGYPGSFRYREF
ncbi:hypothetical protein IT409_02230 [Candidatus Falkowbacteria bacterium]|nr:hypothetical protein [Candidatus Falkowbacteria bacterium]